MEHFVQYHNPDLMQSTVAEVAEEPDQLFRSTVGGSKGIRFVPPLPLGDELWFADFLRYMANFSLGLRKIPSLL